MEEQQSNEENGVGKWEDCALRLQRAEAGLWRCSATKAHRPSLYRIGKEVITNHIL